MFFPLLFYPWSLFTCLHYFNSKRAAKTTQSVFCVSGLWTLHACKPIITWVLWPEINNFCLQDIIIRIQLVRYWKLDDTIMQVQENLSKTVIVVSMSQITVCAKGLQRAFFPEKQQHPWTTTGDMLKHRSSIFRFIGEDWGRASASVHRSRRPRTLAFQCHRYADRGTYTTETAQWTPQEGWGCGDCPDSANKQRDRGANPASAWQSEWP